MAHVQTVLGPIDPGSLGWTLPHEHTQISLWQIPGRWDYWQLTRDEPVILEELRLFRDAGGAGLVDLTLPGVGRDPAWLASVSAASRAPRRHGLRLVPGGLLPGRGAHRATVGGRPGRRTGPRGDRRGGGHRDQARGSSARSAPTSRGSRRPRSASIGPPARAARRTGLAITTHAVLSPIGLEQLQIFEEEGVDPARVVIGHADSYPRPRPLPRDHRARREPRVRLPRHALHAAGAPRRGPRGRAGMRAARARPRRPDPAQPGRLPRRAAQALTTATATSTSPRRSCRGSAPPASATPRSRR